MLLVIQILDYFDLLAKLAYQIPSPGRCLSDVSIAFRLNVMLLYMSMAALLSRRSLELRKKAEKETGT